MNTGRFWRCSAYLLVSDAIALFRAPCKVVPWSLSTTALVFIWGVVFGVSRFWLDDVWSLVVLLLDPVLDAWISVVSLLMKVLSFGVFPLKHIPISIGDPVFCIAFLFIYLYIRLGALRMQWLQADVARVAG
jgi:hypothetical protein